MAKWGGFRVSSITQMGERRCCHEWKKMERETLYVMTLTTIVMVADNIVIDVIKLILLNYSNFSIAKIVVKKIERVK